MPNEPDLIVLPEVCDRFPDMDMDERKAYYQHRDDQIRDFIAGVARENRCYIAYSAAREMEDGTYRNATQLIDRSGLVAAAGSPMSGSRENSPTPSC